MIVDLKIKETHLKVVLNAINTAIVAFAEDSKKYQDKGLPHLSMDMNEQIRVLQLVKGVIENEIDKD